MSRAFAFILVSAALLTPLRPLAAASPFDGTWKLNLAKSKVAGQTFTIEKVPSGKMRLDLQGFAYDFDLSGKAFPTPDGTTASVTAPDLKTWVFAIKLKDHEVGQYRLTVDGDKATLQMTANKEDGSRAETTTLFERVSGGSGHLGKWRSTDASGAPPSLQIRISDQGQISFDCPEMKMACRGAFDGKDHVVKLGGESTKQTLVFERKGTNQIKITTKIDGKPFMVEVFTVSEDGKTLTDNANLVAADEPVTYVFEKQS